VLYLIGVYTRETPPCPMGNELGQSNVNLGVQRDVDGFIRTLSPPSEDILELDFVFEALGHPRRRYLCYSLLSSSRWTLTELATKLVAWEQDIPEDDVTESTRDEMYVSLYHTHIPKLSELAIVRFEDGATEKVIIADRNAVQVLAALEGAGGSVDTSQEAHAKRDYDTDKGTHDESGSN